MSVQPVAKTDVVIERMRCGDYAGALSIAKGFKLGFSQQEKADLRRAHEAHGNPGFYAQLGKDPAELIAKGIQTLKGAYGARL